MGKLHHFGQGARRPSDPASDSAASVKAPGSKARWFSMISRWNMVKSQPEITGEWCLDQEKTKKSVLKSEETSNCTSVDNFHSEVSFQCSASCISYITITAQRWDCGKKRGIFGSGGVGFCWEAWLGLDSCYSLAWGIPRKAFGTEDVPVFICSIWISKTRFFTSLEPHGRSDVSEPGPQLPLWHYGCSVACLNMPAGQWPPLRV